MILNLDIIDSGNNLILTNGYDKFVLSRPQKIVDGLKYCLRQTAPTDNYLSGLFEGKKRNKNSTLQTYKGKTIDGKRIYLELNTNTAKLVIN